MSPIHNTGLSWAGVLTYYGHDKMAVILQTFWNSFLAINFNEVCSPGTIWQKVSTGSCNGLSEPTLRWRHNGLDSVSNHQPHDCSLNRSFGRRSKKTSKLLVTGLCVGNSPVTGEFPAQRASNTENVSIWWRHHEVKPVYPPFNFIEAGGIMMA